MVNFNGQIVLNGVTDKEMALIWEFKAKHGNGFNFVPNMQPQARPEGTIYNNVQFSYATLHAFNLVAEIVNELHKKEETKTAGQ
jgi:hypothetical protein